MRRRLATLLATLVMTAGTLLAVGGAPAQAHYPNGTLMGVYEPDQQAHCHWVGNYFIETGYSGSTGPWSSYACEFHGDWGPDGHWLLWMFQ